MSWPDSIGSCLGQSDFIISGLVQNRSVLALVRLYQLFQLVLARLDHFLSRTESISSCLGQTRSLLVLARLDHFLSRTESISSCLGQTESISSCLSQTLSFLVLDRLNQFLSWTELISSCLGQNRSVIFLDRLENVLSLPHSVSSWPNSVSS